MGAAVADSRPPMRCLWLLGSGTSALDRRNSPDIYVMAMDNRVQRPLTLREVHLWLTFTSGVNERLAETFRHSLLSEDERQREGKFFFAADRHRFVVTRALLRTSLSRYAAVPPAAWRFEVDEYGRPRAT